MFWRSYNLKKAILKQLKSSLKPRCYISKINAYMARQIPSGDWRVWISINYPCGEGIVESCTTGYLILDKKSLKIKNREIPCENKIFYLKTIIQEAEEIIGGKK